ncbi:MULTISPECIES: DNA ligase D [Bacillus]|uniref:DNA ligase D n=1 Tax=Bacillus TaxID=1386 RepID=UPI000318C868|nr:MULTISPECIES: DNA ligase D [Bacillus]
MNLKELFPSIRKKYKGIFFILGYHSKADDFLVGILQNEKTVHIGTFSRGLQEEEKQSLIQIILKNQISFSKETSFIDPGICVELSFQTIVNGTLEDAFFSGFHLNTSWQTCTWEKLILDNYIPDAVKVTHLDKMIWDQSKTTKEMFIAYLIQISSRMLPFLQNKALTTIRYPNGIAGEAFFQKNCPAYAPEFIQKFLQDENQFIVCNNLETLIWLGNQLAIEYHIPFQTVDTNNPTEIVFDLDPPDRTKFHLAIKAAKEMKSIFDSFHIASYPKLSGSKGLQIHIPISKNTLTYDETRLFTSFIANYLIERYPNDFTIERLKKNRDNRLYIDYVQHAEGKTIICPYSTRGKEDATVAAPLFWNEVNDDLRIEQFTIHSVLHRLTTMNCPMHEFWNQDNRSVNEIISKLKENV